jgi:4-hydroxybenzoate polyprenyltransferase
MSEPGGASGGFTDIRRGDWIDRLLPAATRPYARLARLDRPIGSWLLLFPAWWAIALATPGRPALGLMLLFAAGAVLMRGAGCTINDIADREFDARVERTRTRPLPSGAVTVPQALLFLAGQLSLALVILLQLAPLAIWLGLAALPLILAYPYMKRITWWPQVFLGLTFNWSAFVGWAAATGGLDAPVFLVYAGGIAWTLLYDTIYAHQDKEDDALVGVRSTALRFGKATRRWLAGFGALAILLWAAAFVAAGAAWPVWPALFFVALHFAWQIAMTEFDEAADCLSKFRANRWVGWILLVGILAAGAAT